ncbi:MAG: RNA polymerase sigma factor [bacterium]
MNMARQNLNIYSEIISRCQKGDELAFTQLINKFQHSLFTYLLRLSGDRGQAEDLFQETLIRVWRYLPRYRHKNKFASWLFGIAHNVTIDAMRKQKVRDMISYTADLPECRSSENADAPIMADEIQREFEKVLQSLPQKQRQVFLLRQHSDMSFKEIAAVMHQPLNTVLSHMHYAASKLKQALSEKNVI